MDLLTALSFKFSESELILFQIFDHISQAFVGYGQALAVFILTLFCDVHRVLNALMQAFSFVVWDLNIQFQLLIIMNKLFSIFRCLKISMGHFADLIIRKIKTLNLFSAIINNLLKFQILLVHQHPQRLTTILRHISSQLSCSFSLGATVLFESIHFLPQSADCDGLILVRLRNIKKLIAVGELSFYSQVHESDQVLDFSFTIQEMHPETVEVFEERVQRSFAVAEGRRLVG